MAKRKHGRLAYSYMRFSTPEQSMGDSERRQLEAAKRFAERKGLQLDDTLGLTDRGLSGYHGTHRKKGALGRFLEAVQSGRVKSGSVLIVENIDRLGREGPRRMLQDIIFMIWEHGIVLQTLSPEEDYGPGCDTEPKFIALLIFLQRAFDESQQKSMRIREARKTSRRRAREEGRPVSHMCPEWLRVVDGSYEVIPAAAETIRMIFKLKREGVSQRQIELRLNAIAPWTPRARKKADREAGIPGNGWRISYIKKILHNRAVIGEYQPHQKIDGKRVPVEEPILDYYPQVVETELFHAVQQMLKVNQGKGGRTGKATNLFVHICKCAYCGGPMRFEDKGKPPKGAKYLRCDYGVRRVKCSRQHGIRYDEVEALILDNCPMLRPEQVLPDPDEKARESDAILQRIQGRKAERQDIASQVDNFIDQIGHTKTKSIRDRYEKRVAELEQRRQTIDAELEADEKALRESETSLRSLKNWQRGFAQLKGALAEDDPELRMKMRIHLREFIERIEIFATGYPERYDPEKHHRRYKTKDKKKGDRKRKIRRLETEKTADDFMETMDALIDQYAPELRNDKMMRAFLKNLANRRMTKDGRFVRVFFKTGVVVDMVPQRSLASGVELVRDGRRKCGWRFVTPKLQRAWQDFKTEFNKRNGSN